MAAGDVKGGIKNRNLALNETFYEQYLSGTLTTASDGDIYRIFQALREAKVAVEFGTSAGTVVGGTTIDVTLRKNGVSMLAAPVSYVTKQATILAGVLTVTSIGVGDILNLRFSKVGGGTFGQIAWWLVIRPLVGKETRS